MSKCPACHVEIDEASLAAGKCGSCGAPLRDLPQRTITDFTQTIDVPSAKTQAKLPTKPEPPQEPGQQTITLPDEPDEAQPPENLLVRPDVPAPPQTPASLETQQRENLDTRLHDERKTDPNIDPVGTIQFDEKSIAGRGPRSKSSDKQKAATISFGAEQTLDFQGGVSGGDSDSLVTTNWKGNVAGDVKDSKGTIRQKETISASYISKASLVVKSRQFRSGPVPKDQISSPDDAPDYELLNVIGEGGMGVVYAARQSAIARTVAVKMLKQLDAESPEQREKFISEAVVTGELDHPNIVPIYDLGSNDSGALFYSMKRVKGTPWNKIIRDKSLEENLSILLRVADAVAFAHANGVIHRDLKPENTMLGDYGEVLVMDWGLARISPEFPSAHAVSQSDVMGGTPAYMAPEMATGPIEKVTVSSDIYLLGAILYEVIEGRTPHTGSTVMACLFAAAKNKIQPPQHPGELMEIALKAMANTPADRYQTVQELQEAIRKYQSHSESIILTDNAAQNLAAARAADDYDLFSRAMYGFQEALAMWQGNRRATGLFSEARLAYAGSALRRGDFDLGITLLDPQEASHEELISQLEAGRRERESRQRRLKVLKGMVAALVLAVVAIVGVSYVAVVNERDKAIAAQEEEAKQRKIADEQKVLAEAAAVEARMAQAEEAIQRKRADDQKEVAVKERDKADAARKEAERQEQIAVEAKQAEAYEAYVARIGLASAKIEENAFDRAQELLWNCDPALCRWEWGRLSYLCQLSAWTGKLEGKVEAVAYSPDGNYFASGDWDGKVGLWDAHRRELLQTIPHGQYVHAVAFDAAGKRLASGSSDRTVRIYRVPDCELLQEFSGHTEDVLSVRFSPDGRRLLTAGYDNTARLWDIASGQELQSLKGHSWWVWAAEFSPDAHRIVTASQDGKAIVWQWSDASTRYEPLTDFVKHRGPIYAAKFSPDGQLIATGGFDHVVRLWNPDEVQQVDIARRIDGLPDPPAPCRELSGHDKPVCSLAFSPDGKQLVTGGEDNVLRIWQLDSDQRVDVLRGHTSYVRDCVYSPDGQWILSAGRDQQIKLWQPETYGEFLVLGRNVGGSHSDAVLAARFSRDGSQIVTASRDRTARLWETDTQKLVGEFAEGHEFLASTAVFYAEGTRLATAAGDGTTRLWDVASGTEIKVLEGTGQTATLDVSDDGRWIVTTGAVNEVQLWDVATGTRVADLQGHEEPVTVVRFAPGSQLLATGDERGRGRVWRLEGDHWVGGPWLEGHSRAITGLAFTQQGRRLVTASGDNTCGQWDVAGGKELSALVLKHPGWVESLDVSDDGAVALTSCDDGKLRLWSLEDAELLRTIEPPPDLLFTSVDISPDGQLAAAACAAKGTVHLWRLDTGEEVASDDETTQAWLNLGGGSGVLWSALFSPQGDRLLTVGGNDAQLIEVATRKRVQRFSPHGAVAAVDISPDGRLLATGSWDRTVKIWDVATGRAIHKLDGVHRGYVNSVEFSPDGALILTGSDDGTARLWDVATGKPVEPVFRGHGSRVRQARFSSDGSKVLTTSNDKTARIWDARTGEPLVTLVGHKWAVLCGDFSRDGRRVITGGEDDDAIIWDAATGDILWKLAGHTSSVTSVAFSPDGERVITGGQDSRCKLWDARTAKEILTLSDQGEEITSVSFSPNGLSVLTSGRDGQTELWPAVDWREPRERQALAQ